MITIFKKTQKVQKEFFDLKTSEKNEIAIIQGRDVGYNHINNIKEFFQVKIIIYLFIIIYYYYLINY